MSSAYRQAIEDYIRINAKPSDKFSHQARLYRLAAELAAGTPHDDEVLHAAAWLHDLGVFVGHRPEQPEALARWDWIAYAMAKAPELLRSFGFPEQKSAAVLEAVRTHLPSGEPTTFEGVVLRDADILEQLGSVGVLRTVSKVGRDTRFVLFSHALDVLRRNLNDLPAKLKLPQARVLAEPRMQILEAFLSSAETEAQGIAW
jgi:uncharacterized protein